MRMAAPDYGLARGDHPGRTLVIATRAGSTVRSAACGCAIGHRLVPPDRSSGRRRRSRSSPPRSPRCPRAARAATRRPTPARGRPPEHGPEPSSTQRRSPRRSIRAPLVGGGTFDGAAHTTRPVAFWFWAPTSKTPPIAKPPRSRRPARTGPARSTSSAWPGRVTRRRSRTSSIDTGSRSRRSATTAARSTPG